MTPGARVQAAIEILDRMGEGLAAERALTTWARNSRYAGSKDRAAVRDHVFDVLRRRRSCAACGGGQDGRALMLGLLRERSEDTDALFCGEGHAPAPVTNAERARFAAPRTEAERHDLPDWLWDAFQQSLGSRAGSVAQALRHRAPTHLRVNLAATDRATVIETLARDDIVCAPHPAAATALTVNDGARRIRNSAAYLDGLVELQDAASQAVVERLPLQDGMRVLDFCAGGGGKALAMADRARIALFAHDVAPERMRDLPARADRAGASVTCLSPDQIGDQAPFDLVLCDAPCSGSGAWRRSPGGKWALTPQRLEELTNIQRDILGRAAGLLRADGILAYATCSVLTRENEDRITDFLTRNPDWQSTDQMRWYPDSGTDGFFASLLTASTQG